MGVNMPAIEPVLELVADEPPTTPPLASHVGDQPAHLPLEYEQLILGQLRQVALRKDYVLGCRHTSQSIAKAPEDIPALALSCLSADAGVAGPQPPWLQRMVGAHAHHQALAAIDPGSHLLQPKVSQRPH